MKDAIGSKGLIMAAFKATGCSIAFLPVDLSVLMDVTRLLAAVLHILWSIGDMDDSTTEKFPEFISVAVSSHFDSSSFVKRCLRKFSAT